MISTEDKNWLASIFREKFNSINAEQKVWLLGFIEGLIQNKAELNIDISIYYATETGNCKNIAQNFAKDLKAVGFKSKIQSLNKITILDLQKSSEAIFITSTHGEGDPPESAKKFFQALAEENKESLKNLKFAILGIGDRSYKIFCGAAILLEKQLLRLGAYSLTETTLLDVDYQEHVSDWSQKVVQILKKDVKSSVTQKTTVQEKSNKGYNRLSPLAGRIKNIVNLNDIGSTKETYHIEIEFTEPLDYQPGDALGVIIPESLYGQKINPRLYSISSSQKLYPNEVHITVALAWHLNPDGSKGWGQASRYLADLKINDTIEFYIHQNHLFKLPAPEEKIIMIGPGTGIAPFRAFMQERTESQALGENWLFFGEQQAHCDFLYQAEWQEYLAAGTLTHLDLAFSRDQKEKVYVQNKILENSKRFIDWMDQGAYLYVCGRKKPMSEDVEKALLEAVCKEKSIPLESAKNILIEWSEQNRYVKDVY